MTSGVNQEHNTIDSDATLISSQRSRKHNFVSERFRFGTNIVMTRWFCFDEKAWNDNLQFSTLLTNLFKLKLMITFPFSSDSFWSRLFVPLGLLLTIFHLIWAFYFFWHENRDSSSPNNLRLLNTHFTWLIVVNPLRVSRLTSWSDWKVSALFTLSLLGFNQTFLERFGLQTFELTFLPNRWPFSSPHSSIGHFSCCGRFQFRDVFLPQTYHEATNNATFIFSDSGWALL